MNQNNSDLPRIPWKFALPILLVYILAIVAITWPWLRTAGTHVVNHWDPPLHAWKLAYTARQILAGHLIPPAGNMTTFYPHSLVFYFEGLHWPPAFFAAPLLAMGVGDVFAYHASFVVFWALSGLCFWMFLKSLGLGGLAAFLGGLFSVLIPYRTSYTMEFNMQLSFCIPLFFFFLVRFFQRPCIGFAIGAVFSMWLQAMSELYQAVFLALVIPFFALALISRHPGLLASWRKFWLPIGVAGAVGGVLTLWGLWPYHTLLSHQMFYRGIEEMERHFLEPFSYFIGFSKFQLISAMHARREEMSVYPTVALLAGGLAYILRGKISSCTLANGRMRWMHVVAVLRILAMVSFAAFVLVACALHGGCISREMVKLLPRLLMLSLVFAILASVRPRASIRQCVLTALGVAALFGLTMGFGWRIRDGFAGARATNLVFKFVYNNIPFINGFRVISRFSLFVQIFLCAASACVIDSLLNYNGKRAWRIARRIAVVALFALFMVEAIPKATPVMRHIRDVSDSKVVEAFDNLPEQGVIAMIPMGHRSLDSEHMLTISKDKRFFVYAWDGNFPDYAVNVRDALSRDEGPEEAVALLRQLWPTAYIMEDKRPFPRVPSRDYGAWFGSHVETLAEDDDFRLFKIVPDREEHGESLKLVRHDIVAQSASISFELSSKKGARVWLDINGKLVGGWTVSADSRRICIPMPQKFRTELQPNRFRFHAEDEELFSISDFSLSNEICVATKTEELFDLQVQDSGKPWASSPQPWDVPGNAIPVGVRYPCGIEIVASELGPVGDNGTCSIYHYCRFPKGWANIYKLGLSATVSTNEGDTSTTTRTPLARLIDINANEIGVLEGIQRIEQPFAFSMENGMPDEIRATVTMYALRTNKRVNGRNSEGRKVRHIELRLPLRPSSKSK